MHRNGFSLLELSIVLVIIGLIAGGIVAGSSMIRAAELRAIITEQQQFKTAVYTFRDKYLGLPGDLKNAGAFWGYPGGSAANCPATAGSGTETCDGNGNSILEEAGALSEYGEIFMFWQHLANAELINGTYTGIAGSGGVSDFDGEINAPLSKLNGGIWGVHRVNVSGYCPTGNRYTNIVGTNQYNHFLLGTPTGGGVPSVALISPEEAWNMDKKIDDGKPGLGGVKAFCVNSCADVTDAATAEYILSDNSTQCWLTIALD